MLDQREFAAQIEARFQQSFACQNGHYTHVQMILIINFIFNKEHGVRKALAVKNAKQRAAGLKVPKITDNLFTAWRREDAYPAWLLEQLQELSAEDMLETTAWNAARKAWVINEFKANPGLTNQQLAESVSKQFECKITDSCIRGVLHRAKLTRRDFTNDPLPVAEEIKVVEKVDPTEAAVITNNIEEIIKEIEEVDYPVYGSFSVDQDFDLMEAY